jgi:polysaccharide chain length determinant protein (PEP-CTERM system associated)
VASDSPTARLAALERRLAELRNRYTERHPDVQAAEREIAALRAQTSGAQGGGAESGTVPNPVHDQIRLQLVQLEGEIASLQDRQARAERLVQELSGLARVMPEADAEYKRLTRDYEVIKKNYEELVAKRESVRIADDMASQADRGAFRIIDPPKAALLPVSPPRLLLLAGALVGSLGTGVGIALAQALLVRPFDTLHDLQRAYSLPVIASVTDVLTPDARRRRAGERARFAVVAAAFALLFASVAAAEHLGWFGPVRDAHHLRPADAGAA